MRVRLWSPKMEAGATFDMSAFGPCPIVHSVCLSNDGTKLLIGVKGCEVCCLTARYREHFAHALVNGFRLYSFFEGRVLSSISALFVLSRESQALAVEIPMETALGLVKKTIDIYGVYDLSHFRHRNKLKRFMIRVWLPHCGVLALVPPISRYHFRLFFTPPSQHSPLRELFFLEILLY